jgi:competence protein ComEA
VEPLSRPGPPRSIAERVRAWVTWFGAGRLVATSVATVVVAAGAFWLVRTPPPATESSLPRATTPTSTVGEAAVEVPQATAPAAVFVHVAGAVVEPGVYQLEVGARVRDAVVAAGGPTDAADWNALNLAAPAVDGTRVYVPTVGEEVPAALAVPPAAGTGSTMVDVNAATADQLDELPGIGPATAAAIVTERERNGPFLDVDDLDRVPGIGPAKLESLRDLVTT